MKRKKWSKKFEKCRSCGTDRFKHSAKGLCQRCYPLCRRIEQVSQCDISSPGELGKNLPEIILRDPDRFERAKLNVIDQIKHRLSILKINEERLERSIEPIEFESQLEYILQHWRAKKVELHGICVCFDNFHQEQLKDLYELFLEIEELIPWEGIDWCKVSRASRAQKKPDAEII